MYIEFDLPQGSSQWSQHVHQRITIELSIWAERYNHIKYTTKTIKYKYRVCFEDESMYTFFQMTWPSDDYQNYRIVQDLNNR